MPDPALDAAPPAVPLASRRGHARRHPLLGVGPRALAVYRLWAAHLLAHQRPPTFREVVAALGMASTQGVSCHLAALVREGLLERVPGPERGPEGGGLGGSPSGAAARHRPRGGTHPCPHRLTGVTLRIEYDPGAAGERARLALEGGASCPPT